MSKANKMLAIRLLRWFCPPHLFEEIEGDLIQKFNRDLKTVGEQKAKRKLLWNVIRFFRSGIILRNKFSMNQNQIPMFKNYFITSIRHIRKSKMNFAFKLGGLTLAFFSFMAIAIYVYFQFSFDTFHVNHKSIYRVNSIRQENGKDKRSATVPSALGSAMKAEFGEVKNYCILSEWGASPVRVNDQLYRFYFLEADSSIFDVFTFEIVKGDKNALNRPDGLVITEKMANQLFPDRDPLHQIVSFPDRFNRLLEVRAIIKDFPINSSIHAEAIMPRGALADKLERTSFEHWNFDYGGNLFVLLDERANPKELTRKAQLLLDKHLAKPADGIGRKMSLVLEPLADIYMSKPWRFEFDRKGNANYVYVYISLAIFLLIIATVNYLNLSIADFSFRAKEMGIRKVMGALKRQIIFQIGFETLLNCLLALTLSMGLLYFSFHYINQIFDANLRFSMIFNIDLLALVFTVAILIVIASVVFPAFWISIGNPLAGMKRKPIIGGKFSANQILMLAQFAISIFCISITWVVSNQLQYIQTRNIGFNRNNLLTVMMPDRYPEEKAVVLKEEISKLAAVESTSFAYYRVTGTIYFNAWYQVEIENEMKPILLNEMFIDEDFIKTMNIKLVEGRNFQNKNEFKNAFIINETAVKEFGWKNPIGKRIVVGVEHQGDGIWSEGNVIGVVKDFNTRTLHKSIEPVVMRLPYDSWPGSCLNVRYQGAEHEVISKIKKVYEKVLPGFFMDYERVSERYENQYEADQKAYTTLQVATWIILLISCLGTFSMSVFMSVKRQREFGIRKVVGATVSQIAALHVNQFLRVALLGVLLAVPIAYLAMQWWLSDFVYKTEISASAFLIPCVILLVMVILSSGYSAWKSGRMNPIDVIKME
jgi:putative ABC transport system permease protein